MLSVLQPDRIAETTTLIAAAMNAPSYRAALGFPHDTSGGRSPADRVDAVLSGGRIERLQNCLRETGIPGAHVARRVASVPSAERAVRAAIALLEAVEPETRQQIDLLVETIEVVEVDLCESGSSPDDVGRFWISLDPERDAASLAASIRHELVHQALFVEEMLGTLFHPTVDHAPAVVSAVRGVQRPFRSAFHAAAVSGALIRFHQSVEQNSVAETLRSKLEPSMVHLSNHRDVLGCRGSELLDELQHLVTSEPANRTHRANRANRALGLVSATP